MRDIHSRHSLHTQSIYSQRFAGFPPAFGPITQRATPVGFLIARAEDGALRTEDESRAPGFSETRRDLSRLRALLLLLVFKLL